MVHDVNSDRCPLIDNESYPAKPNKKKESQRTKFNWEYGLLNKSYPDFNERRQAMSLNQKRNSRLNLLTCLPKELLIFLLICSILLYSQVLLSTSSYDYVEASKRNPTTIMTMTQAESIEVTTSMSLINVEVYTTFPSAVATSASEDSEYSMSLFSDHVDSKEARLSTPEPLVNASFDLWNSSENSQKLANEKSTMQQQETLPEGYVVWGENCRMQDINPFLKEVMSHFRRDNYTSCMTQKALTKVVYDDIAQEYVLQVDKTVINSYRKSSSLKCCYQTVARHDNPTKAELSVMFSKCIDFKEKTSLKSSIESIIVKCSSDKGKQVYVNGHAMVPERQDVRQRLLEWEDNTQDQEKPVSLLLIGIDSISRSNLKRAMPKTHQFLTDEKWFEIAGLNKIGDNTFPNLMATLTGYNLSYAIERCKPYQLGGLDDCDFIWKHFHNHGYVTAYSEDECRISTFNYLKKGFSKQPTDFYTRPFLMAAEKMLQISTKDSMTYCLGYKHYAEHVYDYALEFTQRYKNDPYFGFFWTNTFSHNGLSDCTSMDERMKQYLEQFKETGALNKSIVIFFSDHGMRFGKVRETNSGYHEERLPFMYIWLPEDFQASHPEIVEALNINRHRLVTPYDVHMTLKHILKLSNRLDSDTVLTQAQGCPNCQSLFKPIPHNRSCASVAIEDHWCTCVPFTHINEKSLTIQTVANKTVTYINNYLASLKQQPYTKICAKLSLLKVKQAYQKQEFHSLQHSNISTYRLLFKTRPNKAVFEATVIYNAHSGSIAVPGSISRLDMYSSDSHCAKNWSAKKYCSCLKKPKKRG